MGGWSGFGQLPAPLSGCVFGWLENQGCQLRYELRRAREALRLVPCSLQERGGGSRRDATVTACGGTPTATGWGAAVDWGAGGGGRGGGGTADAPQGRRYAGKKTPRLTYSCNRAIVQHDECDHQNRRFALSGGAAPGGGSGVVAFGVDRGGDASGVGGGGGSVRWIVGGVGVGGGGGAGIRGAP